MRYITRKRKWHQQLFNSCDGASGGGRKEHSTEEGLHVSSINTIVFCLTESPSLFDFLMMMHRCNANKSTSRIKNMLIKALINTTENKHYKTNPTLRMKMWFLIYVSEHIMVINILIQTVCKSKPQPKGFLSQSQVIPQRIQGLSDFRTSTTFTWLCKWDDKGEPLSIIIAASEIPLLNSCGITDPINIHLNLKGKGSIPLKSSCAGRPAQEIGTKSQIKQLGYKRKSWDLLWTIQPEPFSPVALVRQNVYSNWDKLWTY